MKKIYLVCKYIWFITQNMEQITTKQTAEEFLAQFISPLPHQQIEQQIYNVEHAKQEYEEEVERLKHMQSAQYHDLFSENEKLNTMNASLNEKISLLEKDLQRHSRNRSRSRSRSPSRNPSRNRSRSPPRSPQHSSYSDAQNVTAVQNTDIEFLKSIVEVLRKVPERQSIDFKVPKSIRYLIRINNTHDNPTGYMNLGFMLRHLMRDSNKYFKLKFIRDISDTESIIRISHEQKK